MNYVFIQLIDWYVTKYRLYASEQSETSLLLKLFITGKERCDTNDAPPPST